MNKTKTNRKNKKNKIYHFKDVNGKTLHLVQRVPPTANQPQAASSQSQPQQPSQTNPPGANIFVGGFPGQAGQNNGMPDVSQLIQHLIGGLGDLGQNATFNTTTTVN